MLEKFFTTNDLSYFESNRVFVVVYELPVVAAHAKLKRISVLGDSFCLLS
jgi:hypothetical protein